MRGILVKQRSLDSPGPSLAILHLEVRVHVQPVPRTHRRLVVGFRSCGMPAYLITCLANLASVLCKVSGYDEAKVVRGISGLRVARG